ncbi:Molybdenum transport ATP-binding protein ModC [Dissulfuribacter thermophilus]|uniref:Molybdenum transport ATP-binding protein ModC n=1 Tax=Dissulfuribacter thermophilus TaxID=1156395 RepID=A0A1B9F4Z8_9BACT|nr:ATP-binding cassette domain-containing protein [Dissulfuribacter thermophilus]OCC14933.1 Molybdenum transport ATP-binding protein ModC [Dissulfuribacter thermophilus]
MELKVKIYKKLSGFDIDISFSCPNGSLLALIGPSGAGKTTIVRSIAGLERPDSGFIACNGIVWSDTKKGIWVPPQKRRLGYVFQEYSLFPHLTVEKNIAFAADDLKEVEELIELLGIGHLRRRKPHQISGGERQRVALAQALARKPSVLLLDEPFSALDIATRQKLREELKSLKGRLSIPIVMVTHDLNEAQFLADEMLPIEQGKMAPEWLSRFLSTCWHGDSPSSAPSPDAPKGETTLSYPGIQAEHHYNELVRII